MQNRIKLILAGTLALGVIGAVPSAVRADRDDRGRDDRGRDYRDRERREHEGYRYAEYERPVYYEDLPRSVKRTLDRVRHERKISELTLIRRPGTDFYRAVINFGGEQRVVRVAENGRLLTVQDIGDETVRTHEREWETDWHRRYFHFDREARVVPTDEAPRRVIDAVRREVGRGRIDRVLEGVRHGERVYTAVVIEDYRDNVTRWITVNDQGRVLADTTADGRDVWR